MFTRHIRAIPWYLFILFWFLLLPSAQRPQRGGVRGQPVSPGARATFPREPRVTCVCHTADTNHSARWWHAMPVEMCPTAGPPTLTKAGKRLKRQNSTTSHNHDAFRHTD